jgi:hypothetical protein
MRQKLETSLEIIANYFATFDFTALVAEKYIVTTHHKYF